MRNTILCLTVLVWAAGLTAAAEKAKPNRPQLRDFAWIIGHWQGEYLLPDGFPELGPAGAKVVHSESWQWALGKKFIVLKIRDEIDGKTVSTGEELVGFDEASGKLLHWFFGSTGGRGEGVWSREGDNWTLKWQEIGTRGKMVEGTSHQIRVDSDTYTWQMRDLSEEGKKIPDWPKVTLKRAKPGPSPISGETQKAFMELAEFFVGGVWECELPKLGKVEQTYRWRIKDRFVEVEQKGGDGDRHAVFGLDPRTGKPTWWTFKEDGTVSIGAVTPVKKYLWDVEIVDNGPKGRRIVRATMTRVGDDRLDALVTACQPDPDGIAGSTEVYHRRK